jgi:hypothetical protein
MLALQRVWCVAARKDETLSNYERYFAAGCLSGKTLKIASMCMPKKICDLPTSIDVSLQTDHPVSQTTLF